MPLVLAAPALPLHKAGPYVAAAYIVFVAMILLYVTIMAIRLGRNQRELRELRREIEERQREPAGERELPRSEHQALEDDDVQAPFLPRA